MTVREIQRRIIFDRYHKSFVMHNYTPPEWWECDVFEVTKSGFFREYEIKMSRGDFHADKNKGKVFWVPRPEGGLHREYGETKHTKLANQSTDGPTQFWFVCPDEVITHDDLPAWAGLIWCRYVECNPPPYRVYLQEMVRAPKLHKTKIDESVVRRAHVNCYYRLQNMFVKQVEAGR